MALQVVSMEELKLEVLLEPARTGASVAEVCGRRGISRASFYRYWRRYLEEGLDGLEPRSRRPRSSPGQIDPELEVEIVTLRKRYAGATVRIVEVGELIHVYLGEELLRALAPDRTNRYQKLGKRPRRRP